MCTFLIVLVDILKSTVNYSDILGSVFLGGVNKCYFVFEVQKFCLEVYFSSESTHFFLLQTLCFSRIVD